MGCGVRDGIRPRNPDTTNTIIYRRSIRRFINDSYNFNRILCTIACYMATNENVYEINNIASWINEAFLKQEETT